MPDQDDLIRKPDVPSTVDKVADLSTLRDRTKQFALKTTVDEKQLLQSIAKFVPTDRTPKFDSLPVDKIQSMRALKPDIKRFHGAKVDLAWFPRPWIVSQCSDKFGYLASKTIRDKTKLPFDVSMQVLLGQLGDLMGDAGRDTGGDSTIPSGFTYFGQFVDHDITLDVSSPIDAATDATTIHNMRSPVLDLDSIYGSGPALHPYLYAFPGPSEPPTAIRLRLGTNTNTGKGGPAGAAGSSAAMQIQTDFDVPRMAGSQTAVIGDPRNDENLIVSQFHHAMLCFHNAVVDFLILAGFTGDIFVEAKKIVIHHYQWAVVNAYLKRICGMPAITAAISGVSASVNSAFSMPVEFAVGAYRFGHSMVRDKYWVNFNFKDATLAQVFQFARLPNLPVLSNWVVDFNAFFTTGFTVPVNNKARKIDSVLAPGLETLPGFTGLMAVLAKRNLLRGLALGLPSGQGMGEAFGITPMTTAQLTSGLPANEVTLLNSNGGILLSKTPLWYYVLREAAVLGGGNQLGPIGGRIVAETFVRMLKRDDASYLNKAGGFTPFLPVSAGVGIAGDFTVADLLNFAGVTKP